MREKNTCRVLTGKLSIQRHQMTVHSTRS